MKKLLIVICLTALYGIGAAAQALPKSDIRPNETVLLYADEVSVTSDPIRADKIIAAGFEMAVDNEITEDEVINDSGNIYKIGKDARFDLYFPEKPNGQMIIICPGGGYSFVSSYNEGIYVAEWLVEQGIIAAVLKYRMPNHHDTVPLDDVQNAFRYCRAHTEEWGLKAIGVMGFSAGGFLAVSASTLYVDQPTRPDFSIFVYPVVTMDTMTLGSDTRINSIGRKADVESREGKSWEEWDAGKKEYAVLEEKYSLDKQVSHNCPPAFIALSNNDTSVNPENSTRLYTSLLRNGVGAEIHIYPDGGHGWGFSGEKQKGVGNDRFALYRDEFYTSLSRWLKWLREL